MKTIMRKATLALATPAILAGAMPAMAATSLHSSASVTAVTEVNHGDRGHHYGWDRGYGHRRHYDEPVYRSTRVWRGGDGRYYCRHNDGTTGLLIGGVAGALIGRGVAGPDGDRTLGAIVGGGAGALLGREIDRNGSRCR